MGDISLECENDLEFFKKGLILFQEEEVVLKSQVERLEAEIDEIKRLVQQSSDLFQEDNQLKDEVNIDGFEKQEVSVKTSSNNDIVDDAVSNMDVASIDYQAESLKSIDIISQKHFFPRRKKINPLDDLSLSDSSDAEIRDSESAVVIAVRNFQNDQLKNTDSQQNSVSLTSTEYASHLPLQSKHITLLPKCFQKNFKYKIYSKSTKPKRQRKQKFFDTPHKYTTRYAVKKSKISQVPFISNFLISKTLLNSVKESKRSCSDSEDENDSLPDLKYSISEEFSELNNKANRRKKPTFKPFLTLPDTIPTIVTKTLQMPIENCELKYHIKKCIDVLENDINSNNISNIIFYILRFLSVSFKNPIIDYMNHQELASFLIPVEDSFIAYIFMHIDAHPKLQNAGFLLTVLMNMRTLIIGMDTMILDGLCAFCRVFTRICKLKNNEKEPISLCCDILKVKHKFAPMLIASIAVVWKELFDVSHEAPEEVTSFYGSISLAARRWPTRVSFAVGKAGLTSKEWEASKLLVEHYISARPVYPSEDTINFLFDSIEEICIKESREEESILINTLVIFASYKTWSWTKAEIVDKYLTPNIKKYSYSSSDVDYLIRYCKIYGEICSLNTCSIFKPEKLLMKLFRTGCEYLEYKFLQEATAMALLQLLLSTKKSLPASLEEWMKENESNPKFLSIKLLRHKYSFRNKLDFTAEDMLC